MIAKLTGGGWIWISTSIYFVNFRSVALVQRAVSEDLRHNNDVALFPGRKAAPGNVKLTTNYQCKERWTSKKVNIDVVSSLSSFICYIRKEISGDEWGTGRGWREKTKETTRAKNTKIDKGSKRCIGWSNARVFDLGSGRRRILDLYSRISTISGTDPDN